MWLDCDMRVGDVGFLVETLDTSSGVTTWSMRDVPPRTNHSCEPRLTGWCGETNNRSSYARGMARVVRIAYAYGGRRAMVRRLSGAELAAALGQVGHPGLVEIG